MRNISLNLLVYGTAHGVVDATCAAVLYSLANEHAVTLTAITYLFVLYNLLAFGLQLLFGFICDSLRAPRLFACLGMMLTGCASFVFLSLPAVAVVLAGVGNALFHVGGGSISLSLTPGKAAAPGVFVAPGAIGVTAGILLGKSGHFTAWLFFMIMVAICILILMLEKPAAMYRQQREGVTGGESVFAYVMIFILLTVAIRSLVGLMIVFPWKSNVVLLAILTLSVALGKGLGGILADRLGWTPVAVGSLAASIPLLIFGVSAPALGIVGMFLFNVTMPVTLTVISNMNPGRPGVSFGFTCLALILGALPAFSELQSTLSNSAFIAAIICMSALALYLGLRRYGSERKGSRLGVGITPPTGFAVSNQDRIGRT